MRTTAVGSPACEAGRYNVRALTEQADLEAVAEFLATVWRDEDPYRSFEHPDAQVRADLARDIAGAELILAAYEGSQVVGAVLIAKDRRSAAPILTWLAVAPPFREQAVATALLEAVSAELAARGILALMSAVSVANLPSLRWHLSRGFTLAASPRG
jgi:GNAT superfamily N-acetyltransferase